MPFPVPEAIDTDTPRSASREERIRMEEFEERGIRQLRGKDSPLRILVADDDEDARILLSHILENIGVEVVTAVDGNDCLDHVLSTTATGERFDLILLDLQMPGMDGYSAAGMLRWRGYSGPIVAMTGRSHNQNVDEYFRVGCDYFITKGDIHKKLPRIISDCVYH